MCSELSDRIVRLPLEREDTELCDCELFSLSAKSGFQNNFLAVDETNRL